MEKKINLVSNLKVLALLVSEIEDGEDVEAVVDSYLDFESGENRAEFIKSLKKLCGIEQK